MIIEGRHSPAEKEHMLSHLRELMRDAMDFPWQQVRNFNGILWNHFEMDRLKWRETSKINGLRQMYARRFSTTPVARTQPPQPCMLYQKNACRRTDDHDTRAGLARHICALCFRITGRPYKHPESECERKRHEAPVKNAQARPPSNSAD